MRRTKKKSKKSDIIVFADKSIDLQHDENLGFGAYITRNSLVAAFKGVEFHPLSPLSFPDVQITADGELSAVGSILSSKALLPQLQIPIMLRGDEIVVSFPIPSEKLHLGPVKVTEAALNLGVGAKGFFIEGNAVIVVDQVGSGMLTAKTTSKDTVIAGNFVFDFDFVDKAELKATYSLAKDDFEISGTMKVKKGSLPGVESGSIPGRGDPRVVRADRQPRTRRDPRREHDHRRVHAEDRSRSRARISRFPSTICRACPTQRSRSGPWRSPETGEWAVGGAGKASLAAAGASGTLDITFDGESVTFASRIDVAKGPATGWLDIVAKRTGRSTMPANPSRAARSAS